jgi:hypothetical protein
MKTKPLLLILLVGTLAAQEATDRAILIPVPPPGDKPAPQRQHLEITPDEILSSRTIVRPDQTITIQEVTPQDLAPLPPPPPPQPLTPEQLAARATRIAERGLHRTSSLSCIVHHNHIDGTIRTHIRWNSQDKLPIETFEAWSNINFHHLTQTGNFKKGNTTHALLILCRDEYSQQLAARATRLNVPFTAPEIPTLPNDSTTLPTFVVTAGYPTAEDLAVIQGLHELYQNHHADFIAKLAQIKQQNAQAAAERAANPPDPTPDIIIRYWTPEKTLTEKRQEQLQQEGGENK